MSTESTEIAIPSREVLLAPISKVEEEILEALIASKDLKVQGHVDGEKAGHAAVRAARLRLKNIRTAMENARKEAKRPILDLGEALDNEAKRLLALIVPEESRLKSEEDAYDKKVADEKRAAEAASAKRVGDRLAAAWERMKASPADLNLKLASEASDEAWEKHLGDVERLLTGRRRLEDRTNALRAVGALLPVNLEEMDDETFDAILVEAVDAHKRREEQEAENLRIEEARKERERANQEARREAVRRADLLTALGRATTPEAAGILTAEQFEELLGETRRIKEAADKKAKADADALADLQRKQAEQEREAQRAADALAAQERAAAIAPEREKLVRWRDEIKEAIAKMPKLSDKALIAVAEATRMGLCFQMECLDECIEAEMPDPTEPEPEDDLVLLEI